MISPHPYRAADIDSLSELRAGTRLIGVRLLRELARASEAESLLLLARHAADEMVDEVSAVARDDVDSEPRREKAAEFVVHLRSKRTVPRTLAALVNRVAEAAARARYRSGQVVDFLSVWLFVLGERFVREVDDPIASIQLESAHPAVWGEFRAGLLDVLEGGATRLRAGRRFHLAEIYLTRLRLLRARHDERQRRELLAARHDLLPVELTETADYVTTMVADLFALSLTDLQQRLAVALVPNPAAGGAQPLTDGDDALLLFSALRAARTDQPFERWNRVLQDLGLAPRAARHELLSGLLNHLQRTWTWFFPDRAPFGMVRVAQRDLEAARRAEVGEGEEAEIERLFRRYAETLSFMVRLATEDCERAPCEPGAADPADGEF